MKGGSRDGSLSCVESRARASADCRGCANLRQGLLSPLGSCYHLSISSFKEAGVMTWTHSGSRARGRGPPFDVSREVREGAGGEGQEEFARKPPLPSQASVHKDASSSSPRFPLFLPGAISLPKPLGFSGLFVPNVHPVSQLWPHRLLTHPLWKGMRDWVGGSSWGLGVMGREHRGWGPNH